MSTIICATDTTGAVCFEKIAKEHNRQAIPLIDKQNTQSQEDSICWRKESPISAKTDFRRRVCRLSVSSFRASFSL